MPQTLEERVGDLESEAFRLTHRAARTDEALGSLMAGFNQLTSEVREADARVTATFSDVLRGQVEIIERLGGLDERFGGLEGRQEALEERMGDLEVRMGGIEARMTGIEGRMGGLEQRMGSLETRMTSIEGLLGQILERLPAQS